VPPPAANGTTIVTARVGQFCASADVPDCGKARIANAAAAQKRIVDLPAEPEPRLKGYRLRPDAEAEISSRGDAACGSLRHVNKPA
jgi:hypothetical protein